MCFSVCVCVYALACMYTVTCIYMHVSCLRSATRILKSPKPKVQRAKIDLSQPSSYSSCAAPGGRPGRRRRHARVRACRTREAGSYQVCGVAAPRGAGRGRDCFELRSAGISPRTTHEGELRGRGLKRPSPGARPGGKTRAAEGGGLGFHSKNRSRPRRGGSGSGKECRVLRLPRACRPVMMILQCPCLFLRVYCVLHTRRDGVFTGNRPPVFPPVCALEEV